MLDDLLAQIFGEAVLGRLGRSKRTQLLARVFFGLLGTALGLAGAVHFLLKNNLTSNAIMRGSMVAMFVCLACFCLFNVALARKWRWPGLGFVWSFVGLVVSRVVLGP